ncbi:MAG: hypothetical protein ACPGRY_05805 [Candidatus Latescibacterota bacterium]|nr:hypothetical protein [Candidatus Latescibacterota bacterium]MEE2729144.1 hypothetical protein [Candidatus Latescibacterota bacterium]
MFGQRHKPPKPPGYEPFLMVLFAVLIALLLTVGYGALMALSERASQPLY